MDAILQHPWDAADEQQAVSNDSLYPLTSMSVISPLLPFTQRKKEDSIGHQRQAERIKAAAQRERERIQPADHPAGFESVRILVVSSSPQLYPIITVSIDIQIQ